MKRITVLITKLNRECSEYAATIVEFDHCGGYVATHQVAFPVTHTKAEIYATLWSGLGDYTMTVDHVGGRPNDR